MEAQTESHGPQNEQKRSEAVKNKLFSKTTTESDVAVHHAEDKFRSDEASAPANGNGSAGSPVAASPGSSSGNAKIDLGDLKGQFEVVDTDKLLEHHIFVRGVNKEAKIAISAYKNLRTRVLLKMSDLGVNSLMVVGAAQNVGKTLTSINLAIAMARQEEKRVILVDLDLRSPSIHHLFGFESKGNIVDVAEGKKTLSDILVDPGIPGLKILPGDIRHEDSAEAIVSPRMRELIDTLKSLNDTIVVFDTPPVLGCDDVPFVAPYMDSCLFVVREGITSRKELQMSLDMLDNRINILGVTINRSSEGNFSSYYY